MTRLLDQRAMRCVLHRHPRLRLGLLLGPPLLWLGVAYLVALGALFITALWTANGFTGNIERTWTLDNFRELFSLDGLPHHHLPHPADRGRR